MSIAMNSVLAGCGDGDVPDLGVVSGVVTFEGEPLSNALVVFEPKEGKSSRAITDQQGRYELVYLREMKGAVIGPHTVRITTATEASPTEKLPARYNSQTELTANVPADGATFDWKLISQE